MLNPVLLQSSVEQKEGDDGEHQLQMQLVPAGLRHLPPDTKIEIFNRRTGKIMKGNDAISMKNLPRELLEHAEYEPIVPPLSGESRYDRNVLQLFAYRCRSYSFSIISILN